MQAPEVDVTVATPGRRNIEEGVRDAVRVAPERGVPEESAIRRPTRDEHARQVREGRHARGRAANGGALNCLLAWRMSYGTRFRKAGAESSTSHSVMTTSVPMSRHITVATGMNSSMPSAAHSTRKVEADLVAFVR